MLTSRLDMFHEILLKMIFKLLLTDLKLFYHNSFIIKNYYCFHPTIQIHQ